MQGSERNLYIDVMKGILIILVVIGHLPFFDYNSRTLILIYSFHMPAFLIIGGMLSHINKDSRLSSIIVKRLKNTLLPYFIFSLITFFILPVSSKDRLISAALAVFRGLGDPINSLNLPLWFLTYYFVVMLTFEIIEWLSYKIKNLFTEKDVYYPVAIFNLIFIIPLMYFSYIYAKTYHFPRIPFNVEISLFSLLFVYVGKIFSVYIQKSISIIKKDLFLKILFIILSTILVSIFIIFWYKFSMSNGRIDLNARDYKNARLMYVDAFLGFIIFSYFSYIISLIPFVNKFLASLGENSIYILAYHVPSVFYINVFILPILPQVVGIALSKTSIISIALYASLNILFSLVLAFFQKSVKKSA